MKEKIQQLFGKIFSKIQSFLSTLSKTHLLKKYIPQIKHHFYLAHHGKEDIIIVLWVWGGGAYLSSFFVYKLNIFINISFIQWIISILVMTYFVWHIFIIRKCSPKNPPLTDKEKEERKKDRTKRFFRKLFLQEPITKCNSSSIAIAIDIYVITCFSIFLLK